MKLRILIAGRMPPGVLAGLSALRCARAAARDAAITPESQDMRLVGYNDLQARSGYQPVIQQQSSRWIAYVGHHGGTRCRIPST